ncbi:C6 transcription factor [Colletotrichum truncatum]|uniref:C6 transcription factor n=1 Tax=Colletotrichum truncatum TaxID=5467 RepID=A0ACC3YV57_COLTU
MTSSNFPGNSPACTPTPPAVYHIAHGPRGYERYFGPTSLMSLLHNFDDLPLLQTTDNSSNSQAKMTLTVTRAEPPVPVAAAATRENPGPLTDAAERVRRLVSVHRERQAARDISKIDGRVMVKEPSMLILVALVDPYFQLCNPHLPIWTRAGFRKLLDAAQENTGAPQSTSLTFAMCANNLVLLTLTAMALHGQATGGSSRASNGTIDVEVIQSYIENASRAMLHIGQLLEPRLVNVQALLSLCAVAQVCLPEEVFSLALTLANQVAKSMGLHQSQGWSSNMSPEEAEERRNVLYCLYCLDKAVSWNHGSAPSVGSTAGFLAGLAGTQQGLSDAVSSGGDGSGSSALYMSARFALAQIDDNLYTSLYGPDAAAATQGFEGYFSKINLEGFEARLRHWRKLYDFHNDTGGGNHISFADDGDGNRLSHVSRLDLEVSYSLTRMQLLSRFVEDPEVCSALLDNARSCLVSLQRLWAATSDPGHCFSFAR